MPKRKIATLFAAVVLFLAFPGLSWAWSGKVVGVADGDTITVLRDKQQVKIRLYGIDCPEKGQAFSKRARQFTSKTAYGKIVQVNPITKDRYGRTVAIVAVDKSLLNEEIIKAGFGWVYDFYCHEPICESWKTKQLMAKIDKRGLWQDANPVPPWIFKRQKRK